MNIYRVAIIGFFSLILTAAPLLAQEKTLRVTENSIVRLSCIEVDPAQLTEYCRFAEECGRTSMAKEPGVLFMYSMSDKRQPNKITILEIYADRAAYESHIKTPHFQKYKQGTIKMVQKLELLDQTPLIPDMRMK
ncbi:MAG: antibiotic biosynthesis monooxygenase [Thermoguttaceae bacterium]|nr:antibiotic biosynthesis monooxygenase [Thermoguttaceae bacterium]